MQETQPKVAGVAGPHEPERLLLLFSVAGSIAILFWLLKYNHYGLDFTHESFNLVWMAHPFGYDASTSPFGFVYHPLHQLLGGDVARTRISP